MRKIILVVIIAIIVGTGLLIIALGTKPASQEASQEPGASKAYNMKLESSAFQHNQLIPAKYTCDGQNINPPLRISGAPTGTKSLVLIMDDPDVPKHLKPDGVFDHWLAWNIPPETNEIPEGQEPKGILGKNGGGHLGYTGPCPPDREHRYFFKLYALDTILNLQAVTATKKDLEQSISGHILAQAELMGRYNRR